MRHLSRYAKDHGATLEIDIIDTQHLSSLWYGGDVAEIKYKGYTFMVAALGDIVAELLDGNGDQLAYVKDKYNSGRFYDDMGYYVRNDKMLKRLTENRLYFFDNNWWECYVILPTGEYVDLMWWLDADAVDDAVREVIESMDDIIDQYLNQSEEMDYAITRGKL